jgi:hypothetical protein
MAPVLGRSLQSERSLFFTLAPTFQEFLQSVSPALRARLRSRCHEVRLPPDAQLFFATCEQVLNLVAVVAEDAPDTSIVLPVWVRVAEAGMRFELRIVRDTEMDAARLESVIDDAEIVASILEADLPLLLFFDEEWQYLDRWGPHPQQVEAMLDQWLAARPEFERAAEDDSPAGRQAYARFLDELWLEMRIWYNSSMSTACIEELRDLIASLADGGDSAAAAFA